jgi:hypothetical protein
MYAFLSSYALSRDPGTQFEYSSVGMALLGHVIELTPQETRAGAESQFSSSRSTYSPRIRVPIGIQNRFMEYRDV